MKNLLLVIDPQYDFIDGSLAVEGAKEAMNNLVKFIEKSEDLQYIFVTLDWHPGNHKSFKDFSGEWASHCVQYTKGAAIYDPIYETLRKRSISTSVFLKGTDPRLEEYSFIQAMSLSNKTATIDFINKNFDNVYIAGIAGDVCVLNTLKDLQELNSKIIVLRNCIASIDKGEAINKYIEENKINAE